MAHSNHPAARERRLTLDIREALSSSLDLQDVIDGAFAILTQIIPADHGALCVSRPSQTGDYDWAVAELPRAWFGGYAEMAPHDFVRQSLAGNPNVVLRDSDMITRRDLEANLMYRRSRELGMSMEHVMAVMLHGGGDWHGGVMLYRDERRPFSTHEQQALQGLTKSFTHAVANCRRFGETQRLLREASGRVSVLDTVLHHCGTEAVVIAPPSTEIQRTAGATRLLEAWFSPDERRSGAVPRAVLEHIGQALSPRADGTAPVVFVKRGHVGELRIGVIPVDEGFAGRLWVLILEEVPNLARVPLAWRGRLTPREIEVAERVLSGWDSALIAEDIGCSAATVKKHLQHMFDKLGVSSRAALCRSAARHA